MTAPEQIAIAIDRDRFERREYLQALALLRREYTQTFNATGNAVTSALRSIVHGVARVLRCASVLCSFLSVAVMLADAKLQRRRMIERPWLVTPLEVQGD